MKFLDGLLFGIIIGIVFTTLLHENNINISHSLPTQSPDIPHSAKLPAPITDGLTPRPGRVFRVTAYCPNSCCCGIYSDGITASGYVIKPGDKFVAAPPNIPFGTVLDIPGYGIVPVLDRGGVIKGDRIDVYFDTHQQALNFGIQYLEIKELK